MKSSTDPPPGTLDFKVGRRHAGKRVDAVLAELAGVSRSYVASLIKSGRAGIAGEGPVVPSRRLKGGERLYAELEESTQPIESHPMDLAVVYEDDDIAVVSKPAGIAVHPGAGERQPTLVSGLVARWPRIARVGEPGRPGIVHRLDADVSGLLVVALRPSALEHLLEAFASRRVERRYLTLVAGRLEADTGRIEGPVGRHPSDPTKRAVVLGGKPAVTNYERLAVWEAWSLAEVAPETGRTHQIRVHMEAIGHPIAGDRLYGHRRATRSGLEFPASLSKLDRPFLHARRLALRHPSSGERLEFESELPVELQAVLDDLGSPIEGSLKGIVNDGR